MISRRTALGVSGGLVAVAGAAVAGVVVTMPAGVDGAGAMLAEFRGHTETSDYADADAAPRDLLPQWTRTVGHDVTVVRPGDTSGDDSGSVRADMRLDPSSELPTSCTELPDVGMPWDGGGRWPDLGSATAHVCEGWITVVIDDALYLWTDDELRAPARS
ncbi:hypothetical protein [Blastococcus haudaquaticus]|uniref:Uncharacterized protein n=1 Tax=Blastococcus haudaquaticus TaxID=1938745 RepID=A0A286GHJ2_9ACTN|nr:hypothetical protein [Blastococcus haudaquaticus]SOD95003.1 hypothetical protein SAMN06272739_1065 [Blastococcus haudaquaticus]